MIVTFWEVWEGEKMIGEFTDKKEAEKCKKESNRLAVLYAFKPDAKIKKHIANFIDR